MSWSTLKTEAIVLTSEPFREADRMYTALTPDNGKVSFLGRGARKGKAKLAAHLEPFAIVDIEIVRGKRSTTVISVERIKGFANIRESLDKRLLIQTSLSLLNKHTREHDYDPCLYAELLDWLEFVDSQFSVTPVRATFILGSFALRIMRHLGYDVQLNDCIQCKQKVMPLSFRWHADKGGLVCSDCLSEKPEEWFSARPIREEVVKLLRFARGAGYPDLLKPSLLADDLDAYARIVHDLMVFHLPVDSDVPFWAGVLEDKERQLEQANTEQSA
ncbi:MAG: DNA repair protein RecO [Candidatus Uhrbacteria bacterium]|nr:DNA repair protein RecO [Candidatus Uhrbacteria bacterium]